MDALDELDVTNNTVALVFGDHVRAATQVASTPSTSNFTIVNCAYLVVNVALPTVRQLR